MVRLVAGAEEGALLGQFDLGPELRGSSEA